MKYAVIADGAVGGAAERVLSPSGMDASVSLLCGDSQADLPVHREGHVEGDDVHSTIWQPIETKSRYK